MDLPETAWMYNKLVFEDESFDIIGLLIERRFNVSVQFTDEEIKKYQLSGSFANETVNETLDILKLLVPFDYQINGSKILIGKIKKAPGSILNKLNSK